MSLDQLNPVNCVRFFGRNSAGVEVDIFLDLPQFVAYMQGIEVSDFKDFQLLRIEYTKPIIPQTNTLKN